MARITFTDLPEDHKVSKEEMRKVLGGIIIFDNMPTLWGAHLADPRPSPLFGKGSKGF